MPISRKEDVSDADIERALKEYGDVEYADDVNKKYPIDTEEHIRAAWSYINMPKNQRGYTDEEVRIIKRRIIAAWKRKIDPDGPPGAAEQDLSYVIYRVKPRLQIDEAFRLLPKGTIVKGGRKYEVDDKALALFRLPHFKPPVKLGSHDDSTPAAGYIVGLEVREDGLYAIPEWNESGLAALESGLYRYVSAEVLWEGWVEDPTNGEKIKAPLILGAALLHTPHLGEAVAMFETEVKNMTTINVPESLWERIVSIFERKREDEDELKTLASRLNETLSEKENLEAQLKEVSDKYAELKMQVERDNFIARLKSDGLEDERWVRVLSALNEEDREWVIGQFKALVAQAKALEKEVGDSGDKASGKEALLSLAQEIAAKEGMNIAEAIIAAAKRHPEVYERYREEV